MKEIYRREGTPYLIIRTGLFHEISVYDPSSYSNEDGDTMWIEKGNIPAPKLMFTIEPGGAWDMMVTDFETVLHDAEQIIEYAENIPEEEYKVICAAIRAAMKPYQIDAIIAESMNRVLSGKSDLYSVKCSTCGATIGGDETCRVDTKNQKFHCLDCQPVKEGVGIEPSPPNKA